jgi:glyoxylase-like metal-dependent hydrolase (beta-lactamase superfamily II)
VTSVRHIRLAYNSAYLVEAGGERVLIDTGPDYRGAKEVLATAVAGSAPGLVVATHGHLDHAGLGHWWQGQGIAVALHQEDLHYSTGHQLDDDELRALEGFVRESGAPRDVEAEALAGLAARRAWAREAVETRDYRPAGRDARWPTGLRYEPFVPRCVLAEDVTEVAPGVRAMVAPGHTPGNLVVFAEAEGWLFSGDQLLPEITPTPAIQRFQSAPGAPWRFRSLPRFLDSLRTIRRLEATRCYPGHGEPFEDVAATIDANLAQAEQRTARVLEALRENRGATLYGLSEVLYPRALRKRFWQIISTVQGHLDVLEEDGLAATTEGRWTAR